MENTKRSVGAGEGHERSLTPVTSDSSEVTKVYRGFPKWTEGPIQALNSQYCNEAPRPHLAPREFFSIVFAHGSVLGSHG